MKIKDQIIEFMKGKEKVCLSDLYTGLNIKASSLRGVINLSMKKNEGIFNRMGKGYYNLK